MCAWKFPISTEYLVHTQSRKNLFTHASCTTRRAKFINRLPHYFFFSGKKIYYYYYARARVCVCVFSIQNILHNIGKKLCFPPNYLGDFTGTAVKSHRVMWGRKLVHLQYIMTCIIFQLT